MILGDEGIDPHTQTHTDVAVSGLGRLLDEMTIRVDEDGHRRLLAWAHGLDPAERRQSRKRSGA